MTKSCISMAGCNCDRGIVAPSSRSHALRSGIGDSSQPSKYRTKQNPVVGTNPRDGVSRKVKPGQRSSGK